MDIRSVLGIIIVGFSIAASHPPPSEPLVYTIVPSTQSELTTETPESTVETITNGCEVDLDFSNMGLSTIRRNFISGLNIKSLALRDNSIQDFEAGTFDSLPNLEHLDLSNNRIPRGNLFSFGTIPSLKSLILDNNFGSESYYIGEYTDRSYDGCSEDEYYDGNFGCTPRNSNPNFALEINVGFPEVTYISLRNIHIDSISNYWSYKFPKVMALDVSNNRLTSPNDFFGKIPSTVKNLTMENVGFTSLRIKNSKKITILNLNSNRFEALSSSYCYEKTLCLKNVDELKTLLVADCSIKRIETDAFKDTQKLIYLDISNNALSQIPDGAFGFLHSLSYLDISGNSMVKIPDISALKNLKALKLNNMKNGLVLTDLENMQAMPNIRAISLRSNMIKYIPEDFLSKLQGIQEIDLSENQLIGLSPGSWQKNLKKLYLGNNQITNIEDLQLDQASSLEVLDLELNNITGIKLSAVKRLPETVFLKV